MKVLLFGKSGQLSQDLYPLLQTLGEVKAVDTDEADFTKAGEVLALIQRENPELIINGAAYTAVDKAEEHKELCYQINGRAVGEMAQGAQECGALLIHYSTDYVFDGTKSEPYLESDLTCPISVYGETKRAGEEAVTTSGCNYLLFRISWIYSGRGNDFPCKMLELSKNLPELRIVADQIGSPTWTRTVAEKTIEILKNPLAFSPETSGIYHLVAQEYVSWYDFACEVLKEKETKLYPIRTSEYPTPAERPLNSRLNCDKIKNTFGIELPTWKEEYHRFESER
jgi:dTDP-4-dehydrorhamnose reductase